MGKDLKHSINYINSKVGKQTGFSMPQNYFNDLEGEVLNKLNEENLPKENGFHTPESYFDNVEHSIFNKLSEENLPKENGFNTPENYFDELEESLLSNITKMELPKKAEFDVPKDYFSSLENTILSKLEVEKDASKETVKEVKVISLSQRIRKYIPAATAASVILFITSYFFTSKIVINNELSDSEIVAWLDDGYGETSSYELATLLTDDEFSEDELPIQLEDDEIDAYLNTIDNASLIIEDEIQ